MDYFRIYPFIGEINYSKRSFIILFVTITECEVQIQIDSQIEQNTIMSKAGKITRIIVNDNSDKDIIKIYYTINNHLQFINKVDFKHNNEICFVSGDYPNIDDSLWDMMNCNICFHLGGNIYGDRIFNKGVKKLKKHEKRERSKRKNQYRANPSTNIQSIENKYRECYQNTWSKWTNTLPNTSHIHIWNDRDVVKNYQTNNDKNWFYRMVGSIGEKMYKEYQESTRLDNGLAKPIWKYKINHNCYVITVEQVNNVSIDVLYEALEKQINKIKQGSIILAFTSIEKLLIKGKLEQVKRLYDIVFNWICKNIDKRSIVLIGSGSKLGMSGIVNKGYISIPFFVIGPITYFPKYSRKTTREYQFDCYTVILNQIKSRCNFLKLVVDYNGCITGSLILGNKKYNLINRIKIKLRNKGFL